MLEINKPHTPEVRSAIELLRSRMNVGRLIVERRVHLRLSQDEIARRAGTKQSRVSELETLGGNVRFDTLDKIAWALGLEVTLRSRAQIVAVDNACSIAVGNWLGHAAGIVMGTIEDSATWHVIESGSLQTRSPPAPGARSVSARELPPHQWSVRPTTSNTV